MKLLSVFSTTFLVAIVAATPLTGDASLERTHDVAKRQTRLEIVVYCVMSKIPGIPPIGNLVARGVDVTQQTGKHQDKVTSEDLSPSMVMIGEYMPWSSVLVP
ncbi:hypothetical protein BO94DRAFT_547510 [Aspergillus sclerotioniger CBS 115572]|uniref:Uncharacterized protein n=1 Tax=Aspergillus sclerotioniger CBS 115572 TaxID=1450535 RepID=A0A317WF56_9EURO|nr:hypothetical protein BO94DRAFT_547510 [Aspergillus sclerotioniger CBS 115572]PWY83867.1 hypothetical protein BO94DRAFT_547510 [Aspergillus sclerotioniger CBS 115572]